MRLTASSICSRGTGRFSSAFSMPRHQVLAALGFTALSYWLLSTYELLALRYLRRAIPYRRIVFNSFIAYSFSHTLGFAAFTQTAIRLRLYATARISAIDVATVSAFCSVSFGIGLATVAGLSLVLSPEHAARLLHLHESWAVLVGMLLLSAVCAYALWACFARGTLEIRGWALRAPGPAIGFTQMALGVLDISLSCAVLWALLPSSAHVHYITFLGIYAAAVIAGIISHAGGREGSAVRGLRAQGQAAAGDDGAALLPRGNRQRRTDQVSKLASPPLGERGA